MAAWQMNHAHIEIVGSHFGCYPTTAYALVADEAHRVGGVVVLVQDDQCPNGQKPEYVRWKRAQVSRLPVPQMASPCNVDNYGDCVELTQDTHTHIVHGQSGDYRVDFGYTGLVIRDDRPWQLVV